MEGSEIEFDEPGYDHRDEEILWEVVAEILESQDVYLYADGPEGPWYYQSLTVRRKMNKIYVHDVDEEPAATLEVPDLSDHPNPQKALKKKLDELNEETLNAL